MQRKIFWIVFALLGLFDFETAVKGKNGWVCMVERGWEMFDWPEFWNPKIRAANYLNPQAARSMLPLVYKTDGIAARRPFEGRDHRCNQGGIREERAAACSSGEPCPT
jgi:hypothetical protein